MGLRGLLSDYIYAIFAKFPDVQIRVGQILPPEDALRYIKQHQQ